MSTVATQLKRLALACVALVTLCVIALTGISNFFLSADPQRALALNPLNVDAITGILIAEVGVLDDNIPPVELDNRARDAIRFAPIHARLRGLYGETLFRQGDETAANRMFNVALDLSQTETTALQRTLRSAVTEGNSAAALAKLDVLFRRWPTQFKSFAPIIPYLLSLPDGYEIALSDLRKSPPWRRQFLNYLNNDPGTVDLAYRLQLDLNGNVQDTDPREIAGTVTALLKFKEYGLAHRLFLLTLDETDRENYGYLFNSNFEQALSGRPFDWRVGDMPGVSVSQTTDTTSQGNQSTLKVQFQGKPVKQIGLTQYLYLPAGKYELNIDLDAVNLKAPKGLFVRITCLDPRRTVSKLDIPAGSYRDRILQSTFVLPDSSCKMLQLGMGTDLIAESFRYRYAGTLSIRNISIRKLPS